MAQRTAFIEKIRAATAAGRAHRASVNLQATAAGAYVGGGADPVQSLLAEWTAVGGQGARVSGTAAVGDYVRTLITRHQVSSVLRWKHPLLDRLELDRLLRELNVSIAGWEELEQQAAAARWPAAFAPGLGITSVDWAVAETGTLALAARPGQGRVVSLLPPVYLAILEPSQIVPDLFDLFEKLELEKADLPSNLSLVTGPSKTGDIELKLTTGVHGPGTVHLLVVE
ncbi:MAG: lactate utilization protein C [Planctomycetales bacterium]